jgi:CheY-like chemotaxis protein
MTPGPRRGTGIAAKFTDPGGHIDFSLGIHGGEMIGRVRDNGMGISTDITGWGQASDRQRAREAGFDHHVVKPLEFDRLQQLLGRIE